MTPPRKLSRRRVLLSIPAVAIVSRFAVATPASALKKKPECVTDLLGPS